MTVQCESCGQRAADIQIPYTDTTYFVCSACFTQDMDIRAYNSYVEDRIAEFGLEAR